jgi:hypothetical protein
MGEKIRLVGNDREMQEVIVEQLIRRSGREFARVRFPDAHFETLETTYLKPEPSRPAPDVEARIERGIQAAKQALNGLDRTLRRPKVTDARLQVHHVKPTLPGIGRRIEQRAARAFHCASQTRFNSLRVSRRLRTRQTLPTMPLVAVFPTAGSSRNEPARPDR